MKKFPLIFILIAYLTISNAQSPATTYAEKMGYPKGARVLILHIDDAGMSYDSNEGAILALTKGVANSVSVMMPCPWVPSFVEFLKKNPEVDAGLHLTLTSEWKKYRWGPLMGRTAVPGLTDKEGAMWPSVADVVRHAAPEEVFSEIKAQLERARIMGFEPTHFDSHMGTLFASPEFMKEYIKLGIDNRIPVMMPAGHNTLIAAQMKMPEEQVQQIRETGLALWNAGLPVLDDLHNDTYGWNATKEINKDDKKLQAWKTKKYIEAIKSLKPGVTMMIMHCTSPTEVFKHISDSGPVRKGDMLVMLDPEFKKALINENIILTTWRELMERRTKVKE
ncbi:MAG: polysaccharide deacetylase family protein [Chitinophagaceae bacterium]